MRSVKKGIFRIQSQNDAISAKDKRYIISFANAFGITYEDALKIVNGNVSLLSRRIEALDKNIETSAKLFGISKEELLKTALKQPVLFCLKSENLYKNPKS